jgi:hypothetical protein
MRNAPNFKFYGIPKCINPALILDAKPLPITIAEQNGHRAGHGWVLRTWRREQKSAQSQVEEEEEEEEEEEFEAA